MFSLGLNKKRILSSVLVLGLAGTTVAEELPRVLDAKKPPAQDRAITRTVANLLQRHHVSQTKLSDETSHRAMKQFLRMLDPMKMYFLKADIEEFEQDRDKIDDFAKNGDTSFAYKVYRRYAQRMDEIMPFVHETIDTPQDFTIDEKIVVDRDAAEFPANAEEAKDRWRKTVKYNILSLRAMKKSDEDIRKQLHSRYKAQQRLRDQMDVYELLEYFLTSITTSLDPHTTYMSPRAQDNFEIILKLSLDGIGAQLRSEDGYVTVATIVPNGAAAKDGRLKVGDRIVKVGQEGSPEDVDVVEKKTDDVVDLIRGKAGTKVRLTVEPKSSTERVVYEIARAKIQLEDDAARGEIIERGQKPDGKPFKIGYLNLPSFYLDMKGSQENRPDYRSTTRDVRVILNNFKQNDVDVCVLDLAHNGGGSLTEAISCTGLFIDRGPVVQVKDSHGQVTPYDDDERGTAWDGPLVVMTSKMSASASEIFAGAIKDYGRGIVVGDPTTHGKGTVQTLLNLNETLSGSSDKNKFGALKLTIQQFYLPDGQSTQREGVAADVTLPSITANMDIGEADLDYALPADKVPAQAHQRYKMVTSSLKATLQQAANERIQKSTDFDKLMKRIESYRKQKDEKYQSLVETEYLAKRAELNAEDEDEKQLDETPKSKEKPFDPTFYNEEVLNIAKDYAEALQAMSLARAG